MSKIGARKDFGTSGNLPLIVNAPTVAIAATERAQIMERTTVRSGQERMRQIIGRLCSPSNLSIVVDTTSETGIPAKRPEIGKSDAIRSPHECMHGIDTFSVLGISNNLAHIVDSIGNGVF